MEPYIATEIDRYPNDICPYNETHRLHSLVQFERHVLRCKEQFFPGVIKYLCRYNSNLIYITAEQKAYCNAFRMNFPAVLASCGL